MLCPDFDLCAACEALPIPQHPDNHPMLKMKSIDTIIPRIYRSGQMCGSYSRRTFDRSSFMASPRTPLASNSNSSTPDTVRDPVLDTSPKSDLYEDLPALDLGKSSHPSIQATSLTISGDKPTSPAPAPIGLASNSPSPVFLPVPRPLPEQVLVPTLITDVASDAQEILSTSAATDKSLGTTTVLQVPNSPPQVGTESPTESYEDCLDSQSSGEASSNVPDSGPLFGGFEMQLSHISDLCLNNEALLKRSPTPESTEKQSPSVQFARLSTLSLSGLLDACRLMSDPAEKEGRLSANFVHCMTVPDGSTLAPGVTFVKRWKLLNDGMCEWPEATEVVSVGGASFAGGHLASRVGAVKPGECKEISTTELKVCLIRKGFGFSNCFAIGARSSWEIY